MAGNRGRPRVADAAVGDEGQALASTRESGSDAFGEGLHLTPEVVHALGLEHHECVVEARRNEAGSQVERGLIDVLVCEARRSGPDCPVARTRRRGWLWI
jgi:hypothetical protein